MASRRSRSRSREASSSVKIVGVSGAPLPEAPDNIQSLKHLKSIGRNYDLLDREGNALHTGALTEMPSGAFTAVSKAGCRVLVFHDREHFTPPVTICADHVTNAGCIGLIFASMYNIGWRGLEFGHEFQHKGIEFHVDLGTHHHYHFFLSSTMPRQNGEDVEESYPFLAVMKRFHKHKSALQRENEAPDDELAWVLENRVFGQPERLGKLMGRALGRELPHEVGVDIASPTTGFGFRLRGVGLHDTGVNQRHMMVHFLNAGLRLKAAVTEGVRCRVYIMTPYEPPPVAKYDGALQLQRGSPTEHITLVSDRRRHLQAYIAEFKKRHGGAEG